MFDHFDFDQNHMMSMWEFQGFYENIGHGWISINTTPLSFTFILIQFTVVWGVFRLRRATQMVEKFKEMDKDNSGKLDVQEAREGLQQIELCKSKIL